jgi:hypothetical protein
MGDPPFDAVGLWDNAVSAPAFHRGIKVKFKKMFEGYHIYGSLLVGTNRLDARGYNNVDPRLEHRFQIAYCDALIYRCEKEA